MRRLYSTFAGGWPGTGLLLMRAVAGPALAAGAGLTLWSDPPPMNVTIPAIFLVAGGILLIVGLWTPIAGVSVALTEIWKLLTLPGDKQLWLMLASDTTGERAGLPGESRASSAFLNQEGRAFEMWKHMMQAAEEFIAVSLLRHSFNSREPNEFVSRLASGGSISTASR